MSVLVVTGTDTGVGKTVATAALACHARLAGVDVAVCKPVQTGTADGDDDLVEVTRLSGVTEVRSLARFPEPLAPRAAAERAGAALPSLTCYVDLVTATDRPDRLTLVEGAGGLLVEIGADGATLRDLAAELSAQVLTVVAPRLGTLNHTALTLEALRSKGIDSAGLVIGAWPRQPGVAEMDNRNALARLAPVRAVLPVGASSTGREEFERLSVTAFDPAWVAGVTQMVHSVELLFDDGTDAAVRALWDEVAALGIRSQASHTSPSNRPHVTVTVAGRMDDSVDDALRPVADLLPLPCVIGAPMLFGGGRTVTLVRLLVPSVALLALHGDVHRTCLPPMSSAPAPHTDPGHWTPHVTIARRVAPEQVPAVLALPALFDDIDGRITALRHWDGDAKAVHPIG